MTTSTPSAERALERERERQAGKAAAGDHERARPIAQACLPAHRLSMARAFSTVYARGAGHRPIGQRRA